MKLESNSAYCGDRYLCQHHRFVLFALFIYELLHAEDGTFPFKQNVITFHSPIYSCLFPWHYVNSHNESSPTVKNQTRQLSLLVWPKVITLSGFYCICIFNCVLAIEVNLIEKRPISINLTSYLLSSLVFLKVSLLYLGLIRSLLFKYS
jgi:hypothetical protein